MNRLAVYVFWERDGIVRNYVMTYLNGLTAVVGKLYVVVNGEIQPAGRRRIESETSAIVIQRPNEGVDFWAYKEALDQEGEEISGYDEIVLCNCSCYGPIYPFSEMFDEMGTRDVDFWGITEWPLNEGGYRGTWVLSYFMVFRPHLFLSQEWIYYWKNLSKVYSREECIEKHETRFTGYFAEKGFTYEVYCPNTPGYLDPTIEAPDQMVSEQRCPIIKRKVFCTDYGRFLSYRRGDASRHVFDYIKGRGLYDTNQILEDQLATQHGAYLRDCLQLCYVLSDAPTDETLPLPRAAVCFHIANQALIDESFRYLKSLPPSVDVYITTPECFAAEIQIKAVANRVPNCTVAVSASVGDAVGALLELGGKLGAYECVCAVNDGNPAFAEHCFLAESRRFTLDALLSSPAYVENLLALFVREPRLGLLSPLNALHATYSARYGQEWGINYLGTTELLRRGRVDVPISRDIPPVAPLEGMFWFRPAALQQLLELGLDDSEFQPGNPDGTLYHAVIRALPFFAQANGYLSGNVISIAGAGNQILGLSYLYRQDNLALSGAQKAVNIPVKVNIVIRRALKQLLKKYLPHRFVHSLSRWHHSRRGR